MYSLFKLTSKIKFQCDVDEKCRDNERQCEWQD
jgi:hypothetical protein